MFEMVWQDAVFMIGNLIFFIALIPSVLTKDKPSKWTSFMTATTLTVFMCAYISLSLFYATLSVALTASAWWILFFQKIRTS